MQCPSLWMQCPPLLGVVSLGLNIWVPRSRHSVPRSRHIGPSLFAFVPHSGTPALVGPGPLDPGTHASGPGDPCLRTRGPMPSDPGTHASRPGDPCLPPRGPMSPDLGPNTQPLEAETALLRRGPRRPGSAPRPIGAGDRSRRSKRSPSNSKLESRWQSGKPRLLGAESNLDVACSPSRLPPNASPSRLVAPPRAQSIFFQKRLVGHQMTSARPLTFPRGTYGRGRLTFFCR